MFSGILRLVLCCLVSTLLIAQKSGMRKRIKPYGASPTNVISGDVRKEYIIISTADGYLHAIAASDEFEKEFHNEELLWSLNTNTGPLLVGSDSSSSDAFTIIPSVTGSLLMQPVAPRNDTEAIFYDTNINIRTLYNALDDSIKTSLSTTNNGYDIYVKREPNSDKKFAVDLVSGELIAFGSKKLHRSSRAAWFRRRHFSIIASQPVTKHVVMGVNYSFIEPLGRKNSISERASGGFGARMSTANQLTIECSPLFEDPKFADGGNNSGTARSTDVNHLHYKSNLNFLHTSYITTFSSVAEPACLPNKGKSLSTRIREKLADNKDTLTEDMNVLSLIVSEHSCSNRFNNSCWSSPTKKPGLELRSAAVTHRNAYKEFDESSTTVKITSASKANLAISAPVTTAFKMQYNGVSSSNMVTEESKYNFDVTPIDIVYVHPVHNNATATYAGVFREGVKMREMLASNKSETEASMFGPLYCFDFNVVNGDTTASRILLPPDISKIVNDTGILRVDEIDYWRNYDYFHLGKDLIPRVLVTPSYESGTDDRGKAYCLVPNNLKGDGYGNNHFAVPIDLPDSYDSWTVKKDEYLTDITDREFSSFTSDEYPYIFKTCSLKAPPLTIPGVASEGVSAIYPNTILKLNGIFNDSGDSNETSTYQCDKWSTADQLANELYGYMSTCPVVEDKLPLVKESAELYNVDWEREHNLDMNTEGSAAREHLSGRRTMFGEAVTAALIDSTNEEERTDLAGTMEVENNVETISKAGNIVSVAAATSKNSDSPKKPRVKYRRRPSFNYGVCGVNDDACEINYDVCDVFEYDEAIYKLSAANIDDAVQRFVDEDGLTLDEASALLFHGMSKQQKEAERAREVLSEVSDTLPTSREECYGLITSTPPVRVRPSKVVDDEHTDTEVAVKYKYHPPEPVKNHRFAAEIQTQEGFIQPEYRNQQPRVHARVPNAIMDESEHGSGWNQWEDEEGMLERGSDMSMGEEDDSFAWWWWCEDQYVYEEDINLCRENEFMLQYLREGANEISKSALFDELSHRKSPVRFDSRAVYFDEQDEEPSYYNQGGRHHTNPYYVVPTETLVRKRKEKIQLEKQQQLLLQYRYFQQQSADNRYDAGSKVGLAVDENGNELVLSRVGSSKRRQRGVSGGGKNEFVNWHQNPPPQTVLERVWTIIQGVVSYSLASLILVLVGFGVVLLVVVLVLSLILHRKWQKEQNKIDADTSTPEVRAEGHQEDITGSQRIASVMVQQYYYYILDEVIVNKLVLALPKHLPNAVATSVLKLILTEESFQAISKSSGLTSESNSSTAVSEEPQTPGVLTVSDTLQVFTTDKDIIGYGSHGTVVFRGLYRKRYPVAIKRMLGHYQACASREINTLIELSSDDGHANIVKYFDTTMRIGPAGQTTPPFSASASDSESDNKKEFVYLALQLCHMTLKDFMSKVQRSRKKKLTDGSATHYNDDVVITQTMKNALLEMANGISHLHNKFSIIHRDIKPGNILLLRNDDGSRVAKRGKSSVTEDSPVVEGSEVESFDPEEEFHINRIDEYTVKISDMGLSKQLSESDYDETSNLVLSSVMISKTKTNNTHSKHRHQDLSVVGTTGWQAPELLLLKYDKSAVDASTRLPTISDASCESTVSESTPSETSKPTSSKLATSPFEYYSSADIFSLGCVYYYFILQGEHPFGDGYEREVNIIRGSHKLLIGDGTDRSDKNLQLKIKYPDCYDLLTRMLAQDNTHMNSSRDVVKCRRRPTISQVRDHPFFWSNAKRSEFLIQFSDLIEHYVSLANTNNAHREISDASVAIKPQSASFLPRLLFALESNARNIVTENWANEVHPSLLEDNNKHRKYDCSSVRDCIRLLRNKTNHFHELSTECKDFLYAQDPIPLAVNAKTGDFENTATTLHLLEYFQRRFPLLLMHCVEVACNYIPSSEFVYTKHCEAIAGLFEIAGVRETLADSAVVAEDSRAEGKLGEVKTEPDKVANESLSPEVVANNIEPSVAVAGELDSPTKACDVNALSPVAEAVVETAVMVAPQSVSCENVIFWHGSVLTTAIGSPAGVACRGWLRSANSWTKVSNPVSGQVNKASGGTSGKEYTGHIRNALADTPTINPSTGEITLPKGKTNAGGGTTYRAQLCQHWEGSRGRNCPMKRKGKCTFAHSRMELRSRVMKLISYPSLPPVPAGSTPATPGTSASVDVAAGGNMTPPRPLSSTMGSPMGAPFEPSGVYYPTNTPRYGYPPGSVNGYGHSSSNGYNYRNNRNFASAGNQGNSGAVYPHPKNNA